MKLIARLQAPAEPIRTIFSLPVRVYGQFTEGFNTADPKEAKAQLDELE